MKKLLHIIATPRGGSSSTLKVSGAFLDVLKKKRPGCTVDELDLFAARLPGLTAQQVDGKYVLLGGKDLPAGMEKAWEGILAMIERFIAADSYLISAPMWNFSIPYVLKHYIDIIVQPKHLFRYTVKGSEGLVKGKKMAVITSRGGDYSPGTPFHAHDLQEPYLRSIFGLVGITDVTFVNAQPMDALGPAVAEEKIRMAQEEARRLATTF